ncbi:MAG: hypothetical protein RBR06_08850 [Desulfuromonadaceae bacterium]|nr:hypothetical protein [Desulfuromonadaceae bacterium]
MKVKQWFSFCALLCSILLLSACGSNSGSGGDQSASPTGDLGTDAAGIKYAGSDKCIDCHDGFSWSADIVDAYLMGKHVIHSDHITAANKVDGCLVCHDPIGDGPLLEGFIDPANVPTEGLAAIGCEACHGAGGNHYGVGPMPVAQPGMDACASCHDELPGDHLIHHPEANFISSNYAGSRHYTASVRNSALCSKCHTDVGGRLYKDVSTKTEMELFVKAVDSSEPVQCKTCHDPHHVGGGLLMGATRTASAEYNTCVACHMSDRDDPNDPEWMYHAEDYYRIITDTHYDDPATPNVIEGYTLNPLNERSCRDCHDVHSVMEIRSDRDTATLHDQWSQSGHAGNLGTIKKAAATGSGVARTMAIKAAGADITSSWAHYDWDAGDRQSCQKCHTSTGFVNYAKDSEAYDAANNDFSHLDGWKNNAGVITPSGQNEMLYCWGCHSDNSGGLNYTGAVTADYQVGGADVIFPDSGDSNTCYVCHAGRGNNETVASNTRANTHHGPAAATLFSGLTNVAYQYPGQNYANVPYFAHDKLDLDGDGPCVSCHMDGAKNDHTFAVVNKDAANIITSIRSESCLPCHRGEHAMFVAEGQIGETHDLWNGSANVPTVVTQAHVDESAAELELEAKGYQQAGEILTALLSGAGITGTDASEANRGAFQNSLLVTEEKGGYAHNRNYVKKVLFDSIDWVTNGSLTGSITINVATYPAAAAWFYADAGGVATRP